MEGKSAGRGAQIEVKQVEKERKKEQGEPDVDP